MPQSHEEYLAQARKRYKERKALGLCTECPMPSPRFARCVYCREVRLPSDRKYSRRHKKARRTRNRAYYLTHRAEIRARQAERYQERHGLAGKEPGRNAGADAGHTRAA